MHLLTLFFREHAFSYKTFEDHLCDILSDGQGKVPLSKFMTGLRNTGLSKDDPRLLESMTKFRQAVEATSEELEGKEVFLDRATFKDCIKDNIVLIRRAFTADFVIPEFSKFCSVIDDIYWMCRTNTNGRVASYIPQLSRYSADIWGVALCTIDGQRHRIGDTKMPFSVQSCTKPINYALALNELGHDVVHEYVGYEPSGSSFNNIKLGHKRKPHNPMNNAGALVVSSLIKSGLKLSDRFDHVHNQYTKLTGGEYVGFNNAIFLSEREISDHKFALGYYLKDNKCFPDGLNLHEIMDFYFQLCSIELTLEAGSVIAATLANGGYCPITGEQVLDATSVRNTLAVMHSCGMYQYSGEFAFRVGLPAKSGASGVVLLVVPNVCGIATWSPPLDSCSNSVRGVQFCEELVQLFNFHHYDNLKHTLQKYDPRIRSADFQGSQVVKLLFGAYNGDISALRRMALTDQDMSIADYDGRTALHLAAAEGQLDCVKFLLEKCQVPPNPRDRWGHTPLDDAVQFQRQDVRQYLDGHLAQHPSVAYSAIPTDFPSDSFSEIVYKDITDD
ncbi:hypothetical protein CAPTEDRAFT_141838 [Capitella teleta]|uniref:glutaminase n=1 Tax=Capitella teleta TaxID=283909 RepID=R7UYZ4_CAPTE|nr:hypothetical protein CAPTEDRAFT_141838 [Capitella teleta]|eukprot:ELU11544.1 hypothetical protein CAPTEDRAFT_141838 [Capitella teleta]